MNRLQRLGLTFLVVAIDLRMQSITAPDPDLGLGIGIAATAFGVIGSALLVFG